MKNYKRFSILGIVAGIIMGFSVMTDRLYQEPIIIQPLPVKIDSTFTIIKIPKIEIDETDLFLNAIGFYESGNRYKITNRFGYMGRYQFGRSTLRGLGYKVSRKEFLNSPELQERAMLDLLSHNQKILRKYIKYWDGKKVGGKVITESGILAAAHLVGPGGVKKFFRDGKISKDGNGTSLLTYMKVFSGYDLNLE